MPKQPKRQKRPPVKPKHQKESDPLWISCRATRGCEGKTAVIVRQSKRVGGGVGTRYRCTTCNRPFHINI